MPTTTTVGSQLPEFDIPITATLVAGGALATRDWSLVHHDKAAAEAAGAPDIFMNILTTNGLIGRFLTDWAGPQSIVQEISIKLGASNFPGDTMTLSGTVSAFNETTGKTVIDIKGQNSIGLHASGSATVFLHGKDEA